MRCYSFTLFFFTYFPEKLTYATGFNFILQKTAHESIAGIFIRFICYRFVTWSTKKKKPYLWLHQKSMIAALWLVPYGLVVPYWTLHHKCGFTIFRCVKCLHKQCCQNYLRTLLCIIYRLTILTPCKIQLSWGQALKIKLNTC